MPRSRARLPGPHFGTAQFEAGAAKPLPARGKQGDLILEYRVFGVEQGVPGTQSLIG
jgi:hypothetical protein